MLSIELQTMGCHARALVDADGACARAALDRLPAWCAKRERALSRFDPESALARLNARGRATDVDEILWEALDVALRAAVATEGLITPTVLAALEGSGYDRSFEHLPREQSGRLAPERAVPSFREIERDERSRTVRLPPSLRLDLGGTAKGWSADAAASMLSRFGPALVDLGGDIAAHGAPLEPWPIAVEDPRGASGALALVLLREGGIATTGRDHRRWTRDGVEQHHVIDPRTGRPARTDVWTATVIAGSALDADIGAKRLLLEGSQGGLAWIEEHRDLAALVVRADGLVLQSTRFSEYLEEDST